MKYKQVTQYLIDNTIELTGIYYTIELLLDCDFTVEQLCKLGFSKSDIETTIEDIKEREA